MRVVVDPNVLVAAAITDGVSAQLLDHWLTVVLTDEGVRRPEELFKELFGVNDNDD